MSMGEATFEPSAAEEAVETHCVELRLADEQAVELFEVTVNGEWKTRAACKNKTHIFFGPANEPKKDRLRREAQAKQICKTECEVIGDCLRYIRAQREEAGVWAGYGEDDRDSRFYARR